MEKFELMVDVAAVPFQTFTYLYDEKGRLKQAALNGLDGKVIYDKDDLAVATINHLGAVTTYENDGLGRTTRITDPIGNIRKTIFDVNGNSSNLVYEFISAQTGIVASYGSQVMYDSRNRPFQTIDQLGNIIKSIYDDRNLVTQVVNSIGQTANLYYDINGQAIRTTVVKSDGHEYTINRWHRDLISRLTAFEDAEGNRTDYVYDERGFPTRTIFPDGTSIVKQYYPTGFLQTETDGNGTTTTFTHNNLSQLTRLSFQNAVNVVPTADILMEYDALGRKFKTTQGGYVLSNQYDDFGRVVEEKQGVETVKRFYDDPNNRVTLKYPDGREDIYQHDTLGRLREIIFHKRGTTGCLANDFAEGTKLAEYQYDGIFLAAKKYANGITSSYSYNLEGQFTTLEMKNAAGNVIDSEHHLYDGEKRRKLSLRPSLPGQNKFYNYDELSRLVETFTGMPTPLIPTSLPDQQAIDAYLQNAINTSAAITTEKYVLTDNDRRSAWQIGSTQFTPTYNNLLQLTGLTATDGTNNVYSYDNNGNRTSDANYEYSYDVFDNLIRITSKTDGSILLENTYDPEGRLIHRKINQDSTAFYYDGLRAVQEKSQQNQVNQNSFGIGLDEYIIQSKGQANYFCHQDTIQSIKSISDPTGNIHQYFGFDTFGKPLVHNHARTVIPTDQAAVLPVFGGRPYLHQLNLYDFRKRVYDPIIGSFIQRDLYNYADSNNMYLFVKHDPVNNIDPKGTIVVPLVIAVFVIGGSLLGAGYSAYDADKNPQNYKANGFSFRALGNTLGGAAIGGLMGVAGEGILALGKVGAFVSSSTAATASLTKLQAFGLYGISSALSGAIGRAGFHELFPDEINPITGRSLTTDFFTGGALGAAFRAISGFVESPGFGSFSSLPGTGKFGSWLSSLPGAKKVGDWFRFGNDLGGKTQRSLSLGPYPGIIGAWLDRIGIRQGYKAVIENTDELLGRNWFAIKDTGFHELFHDKIGRYLPTLVDLSYGKLGAVARYPEEAIAYALGHLRAFRFHAVPFAPFEAFNSISPKAFGDSVKVAKDFWGRIAGATGISIVDKIFSNDKNVPDPLMDSVHKK